MDVSALIALALLAGAIVFFKLSTLQWRWPVRLAVWLVGAAALVGAAGVSVFDRENYGVWRALGEMAAHWRNLGESLVWSAVTQNWRTLPDYFGPIVDFAVFAVGLVGLLCLFAFTPGKKLEHAARGLFIGVIGMVMGAFLTVGVVALGFGGEAHRTVIVGEVSADDVLDGDTFLIGSTSIRLRGVDAPELHQTCRGAEPACGQQARAALQEVVNGQIVKCTSDTRESGRRVESFGRPIMDCMLGGDAEANVAIALLRRGVAVPHRDRSGNFTERDYSDQAAPFALGCTLEPGVWRRNHAARRQWLNGETVAEGVSMIGCEP